MAMSRTFQIKNLPLEILEHIWSYLDFHNCQKICTLVSMVWFWGIRNSSKLSTEMKIKRGLSNEEVNFALDNWPKIQILEVDDIFSKVISDIQKIKNYEDLDKIICRPNSSFTTNPLPLMYGKSGSTLKKSLQMKLLSYQTILSVSLYQFFTSILPGMIK